MNDDVDEQERIISVLYTNHRGNTSWRRIIPRRIWFGSTEWHPGRQWIIEVFDLKKNSERSFALTDIKEWAVDKKSAPDHTAVL